jgi:Dynamin family
MDLREYEQNKFAIAEVLRSVAKGVPDHRTDLRERIRSLLARLAEDRFNLVVVGRFSRGKTSLMNAIMRTDRLPTGITPLTSVITSVAYGSKERVILNYAERILTKEVPIEDLPKYITQQGNPRNVQRIKLAEVQLPAEILRRGFYFIDTPGLGSVIVENTLTTQAFLPEADAFILVTSYESPLSEEEIRFFKAAASSGRRVFVVLNKQDTVGPEDRRAVLSFVHEQLASIFGPSTPSTFSVSAKDALAATQSGDPSSLDASGMPALEKELVSFLLMEKTTEFLLRMCDRLRALLLDFSKNEETSVLMARIEALAEAFGRDRADQNASINWPAVPSAEFANLHQLPTCAICGHIAEELWQFLCRYQYQIVENPDEQRKFAIAGGFCSFHTWEYASIASPYGTCTGYPPLLERLADDLRVTAATLSRDELLLGMRELCPPQGDCVLCHVRDKAEVQAIETTAKALLQNRTWALTRLSAICLPHLTMLSTAVEDPGLIRELAKRQATIFQRMAEDMRRYALKHDALRRSLETNDEETAADRALFILAGYRNVIPLLPASR